MLTLWDLLPKSLKPRPAPSRPAHPAARRRADSTASHAANPGSMQAKYDLAVRELLAEHNIRVRKWRTSMSGIAWEVYYHDGRTVKLIEAPRPKGPMSAAVFLHEIGHHAIGFHVYKPRCLEEHHAWKWALEEMERRGLNITPAVRTRVQRSMRYAIGKAARRGIKALPAELGQYL